MFRVNGFDVRADVFRPIRDDRSRAAGAADFVRKFPRENRRRALVSVDNEADPGFVGGLRIGVRVERVVGTAESFSVSVNTAKLVPVIEKGKNELHAFGFSCGDDVVKPWNASDNVSFSDSWGQEEGGHTGVCVAVQENTA